MRCSEPGMENGEAHETISNISCPYPHHPLHFRFPIDIATFAE